MSRWRFVVSGRVQGVGYRALVKQVASELGIKGVVRNSEDRTVEIFCECDPDDFDTFKQAIDVKGDPVNFFAPVVKEIKTYPENSDGYKHPPSTFGHFEIDYGIKMSAVEKESMERSEIGILALSGIRSDIQAMHKDMNQRFDTLDVKYGEFGQRMGTMDERMATLSTEIHKSTEALVSFTQKVGALIDKKLAE
jgi:acylphosphatase